MYFADCKRLIKSDYARLPKKKLGCFFYLITNASFKITFWFRVGSWLKDKSGVFRFLYAVVCIIYKHYNYLTGIQLPLGTRVGGGHILSSLRLCGNSWKFYNWK